LDSQQTPERAVTPPPPDETIDDAQLSPRAWLARNGPALMLMLAAFVFIYYKFGLEGMWTIAKVALGLGAVVFIHELGHFLVAKWCDVHVETFSIGFGPALPGCSYKWGETTYKLALFPLGGYVKMLGEGGENDEEDTDPRSYKNKSVGQRMAIISAGVVMNVLFGLVVFVAAFKIGVHQHAPVIGVVEAGGPAWQKGVRTGDVFTHVDDIAHPTFEDLKAAVMLTGEGEHVSFVFQTPGGEDRTLSIEPRKTKDEPNPVIGVRWPMELKLPDKRDAGPGAGPAMPRSAAAAARRLDLGPDDALLAATDARPLNPVESPARGGPLTDLERIDPAGDLAQRLLELVGKPVQVKVRRGGKEEEVTLEPDSGFHFGDKIVGTTDPENNAPGAGFNPFKTSPLQKDPRDPQGRHLDYFQFLERLKRLAGQPVVIQVERKGSPEAINLFVPPSYHQVIPGLLMEMGRVSALREGSSAQSAGVKVHDTITAVTLSDGKESVTFASTPAGGERQLDPLRLPYDLRQWAADRDGVTASLKVQREIGADPKAVAEVNGLKWDNSWRFDEELPLGFSASMPIPELGLAYRVPARVKAVAPGSYADKHNLHADDFIVAWTYQEPPEEGQTPKWRKPTDLGSKDNPTGNPDPGWAGVFYTWQLIPGAPVRLWVKHPDGEKEEIEMELQRAADWPLAEPARPRGLPVIAMQDRITVADSLGEAVQMGFRYTKRTIVQIYVSIKSLVTRRVSATENLQGPIDIAVYAYATAESGWADFFLLLGLISVNLAVVNFLPIPILDGGHMVFLLYEKLRGRPASEHVRLAANWAGLLLLVSLMGFVIYLGFTRWIWPLITH
jgi:regulator of sigma E protease